METTARDFSAALAAVEEVDFPLPDEEDMIDLATPSPDELIVDAGLVRAMLTPTAQEAVADAVVVAEAVVAEEEEEEETLPPRPVKIYGSFGDLFSAKYKPSLEVHDAMRVELCEFLAQDSPELPILNLEFGQNCDQVPFVLHSVAAFLAHTPHASLMFVCRQWNCERLINVLGELLYSTYLEGYALCKPTGLALNELMDNTYESLVFGTTFQCDVVNGRNYKRVSFPRAMGGGASKLVLCADPADVSASSSPCACIMIDPSVLRYHSGLLMSLATLEARVNDTTHIVLFSVETPPRVADDKPTISKIKRVVFRSVGEGDGEKSVANA